MRARIRGDKTTKSFAGPLDLETESTTSTFEAMIASTKNNPQEADLDGKEQDRDLSPIYTAENFRQGSDKSGTRTQKNSTD